MPTSTYTPLANITLGSSQSTVVFSSISQSYRDLIVVFSGLQASGAAQNARMYYNNDQSGSYYLVYADGSGSSTSSGTDSANSSYSIYYVASTANTNPNPTIVQIMDYSATDKHKTSLVRTSNASGPVSMYAARWASTSAITSITIYPFTGGNFLSGTTATLYGIAS